MKNRTYLAITLLLFTGLLFRQVGAVAESEAAVRGGAVFYAMAAALLMVFLRQRYLESLPAQPVTAPEAEIEEAPEPEPRTERVEEPAAASLGDGEDYFW